MHFAACGSRMVPFSVQLCVQMVNIYKVYWPLLVHTGGCIIPDFLHQNLYNYGSSRHLKMSHRCRLQHTCTGTCRDIAAQAVARSKLSANAANCVNAGSNCCLRLCLAQAAAPISSAVQPRQRGTSAVTWQNNVQRQAGNRGSDKSVALKQSGARKPLPGSNAVDASTHAVNIL